MGIIINTYYLKRLNNNGVSTLFAHTTFSHTLHTDHNFTFIV